MLPFIAPIAAAGINYLSGQATNQANRRQSNSDKTWQKFMSDTAHQRETEDLKKAGLNPILSAGGSGASSGGSGSTPMQPPEVSLEPVFQALQQQNTKTQLDQAQQQINIQKANSAAGIAKNLTEQELIRAKTITEKTGGFLKKWLGAEPAADISKGYKELKKNLQFGQPKPISGVPLNQP
ncbi:MAG: DNA pilot protein [Microvirus sp.]|nr:MAG: DNA pilot protein [Microvirus sp.]